MRAPAKLEGELSHRYNPHIFLVPFSEERGSTLRSRVFQFHETCADIIIRPDLLIHETLDFVDLSAGHRIAMREIKSQSFVVYQRASLLNMSAQYLLKHSVQQMRRRVIGRGSTSALCIHFSIHLSVFCQRTGNHLARMGNDLVCQKMHIRDLKAAAGPDQKTLVSHLSATLCIKGCGVENHQCLGAFADALRLGVFGNERQHRCIAIKMFIAREVCSLFNADFGNPFHPELTGCTGTVALTCHGFLESFHIHGQSPLPGIVRREIRGKAKRVVKPKSQIAWNHRPRQFSEFLLKNAHALPQGLGEAFAFNGQCLLNALLGLNKFRTGFAHLLNQRGNQFMHERPRCAGLITVANRTADDAAKHIPPTFVRGDDAVRN